MQIRNTYVPALKDLLLIDDEMGTDYLSEVNTILVLRACTVTSRAYSTMYEPYQV